MDGYTLIAICIIVLPIHYVIITSAKWFMQKIDGVSGSRDSAGGAALIRSKLHETIHSMKCDAPMWIDSVDRGQLLRGVIRHIDDTWIDGRIADTIIEFGASFMGPSYL